MSRFRTPPQDYYRPRKYSSPEQAAGMTGLHRDMRGNIIGGYAPDGRPLGSRARVPETSATPRLDAGVRTPNLDLMQSGNPNPAATQGQPKPRQISPFRAYTPIGDGATKAAAPGSQLLRDRRKLFDDMTASGETLDPNLAGRARKLGIADSTFRRVGETLGKKFGQSQPVASQAAAVKPDAYFKGAALDDGDPTPPVRGQYSVAPPPGGGGPVPDSKIAARPAEPSVPPAPNGKVMDRFRAYGNQISGAVMDSARKFSGNLAKAGTSTKKIAAPFSQPVPPAPSTVSPTPSVAAEVSAPRTQPAIIGAEESVKSKIDAEEERIAARIAANRAADERDADRVARHDFGFLEGTGLAATLRGLGGGGFRKYRKQ